MYIMDELSNTYIESALSVREVLCDQGLLAPAAAAMVAPSFFMDGLAMSLSHQALTCGYESKSGACGVTVK